MPFTAIQRWTFTRRELLAAGYTARQLTAAVATGSLVRVRKGHYAPPDAPRQLVEAVRVGGLSACVSAARLHGVWTVAPRKTHVWLRSEASRLRSPGPGRRRLTRSSRDACTLHWRPLLDPDGATGECVSVIDAIAQMALCCPLPFVVAAIDSALNLRLVTMLEVNDMCARLPVRARGIRDRVDGRCESGIETFVRLMMVDHHIRFEPQVTFAGIGDVDFVVEGCVVIEVDGHEWHDSPDAQARDYGRDIRLAALGYTVLRFDYQQVMFEPDLVLAAITSALRNHRDGPSA